ncbi:serine/threonine-protein kinase [Luedemannella helvata]|uniref:non-specific serine/threonine protein kinase n=1 Tax=Luedemannella helvata TaxID=349315 RepID=A0ABP4X6J8_9ACTN
MSVSAPRVPVAPDIPGYEYLSLLGSGGFADVFLYRQSITEARRAVKVLRREDSSEEEREQFLREARALGRLSHRGQHPHIVAVHSVEVVDGRPCLIMEYCERGSYAARVRRDGTIRVPEVLRVGVQIASALETAHLVGILHRDLKPGNLLIAADGAPKLSDFGIATVSAHELTEQAKWFSPHYAAPEVVAAGATSPASDVYSLASTLYELLTGAPPFRVPGQADEQALRERIRSMPVPPISRGDVPADLDRLLRAAMTKDPGVRQRLVASAGEFALRLREIQQAQGYAATDAVVYEPVGADADPSPDYVAEAGSRTTRAGVTVVEDTGSATTRAGAAPAGTPVSASAPIPRRDVFRPHWERVPFDDPAARPTRERAVPLPDPPGALPDPPPPAPAPVGRGVPRAAVAVLAVLVVVVLGAGVLLLRGGDDRTQGATPTRPPAAPGLDAVPGAGKPVPSPTVTAERLATGSVRFTWTYDSPADGDYFKVRRTDVSGAAVRTLTEPELVVTPKDGQTPCVDVYVYRADGRGSQQPGRACAD